jgi:hypothetical protein
MFLFRTIWVLSIVFAAILLSPVVNAGAEEPITTSPNPLTTAATIPPPITGPNCTDCSARNVDVTSTLVSSVIVASTSGVSSSATVSKGAGNSNLFCINP